MNGNLAPVVENLNAAALRARFGEKTARVGIIGLGYVGLPLSLLFAGSGLVTTGFDIDPVKVEKLRRGESYIKHIADGSIATVTEGKRFWASADFSALPEMDTVIICVPTPLDEHHEPDLSYVRNTVEAIRPHLRRGQLIVLESTTYPGTTEEVVLPILEKSGLCCPVSPYETDGQTVNGDRGDDCDFLLAFSPEREDPGNEQFKTHQIPKVIGGVNAPSALAAQALYEQAFERTLIVSSSRTAEMSKLLENIYRCVNIALVNEMKLLCMRMGIDIWEVIEAAKTKPFGFTAFYPGPGLGGHCIPIDPFYLTWKAREYEFSTRFIELAGQINTAMPCHVVDSVAAALNRRKQCLQDSHILVLGVAYKKDVDDVRESPSLRIMELLEQRGAEVDYHDPYLPRLHRMRHYDLRHLSSVELTAEALAVYDAVVIATDHSIFDYPLSCTTPDWSLTRVTRRRVLRVTGRRSSAVEGDNDPNIPREPQCASLAIPLNECDAPCGRFIAMCKLAGTAIYVLDKNSLCCWLVPAFIRYPPDNPAIVIRNQQRSMRAAGTRRSGVNSR